MDATQLIDSACCHMSHLDVSKLIGQLCLHVSEQVVEAKGLCGFTMLRISNNSLQCTGSCFAKSNEGQISMEYGRSETNSLREGVVLHLRSSQRGHVRSLAIHRLGCHRLSLVSDARANLFGWPSVRLVTPLISSEC